MTQKEILEEFRKGILILGSVLVGIGALLLIWFGVLVFQIVYKPTDVGLMQYAMQHINVSDAVLYGNIGGSKFQVNGGDSVRTLGFLFIGVLLFAILAGIVKSVVAGGMQMISFALGKDTPPVVAPPEPQNTWKPEE